MKFISEKSGSKAIPTKVIAYVQDNNKVCRDENGQTLMATIGLDDTLSYDRQFRETAMLTGNYYGENDRKYYHFKYTCSPDDYHPDCGHNNITPEQLLEEAITLCTEKLTGYQALIVVQYHNNGLTNEKQNRAHLHAHIVLNASPYDASLKRLQLSNQTLRELRDYAYEAGCKYNLHERYWLDEVNEKRCRKEALSVSQTPLIHITEGEQEIIDKHGTSFAEKSFKERYRIAIDEARKEVTTLPMFQTYLKKHFSIKTEVTQQGNIKFKFPDRTTYTSGQRLGNQYTLEAIMESLNESKDLHMDEFTSLIEENDIGTYGDNADLTVAEQQAIVWRTKILDSLDLFLQWEKGEKALHRMQADPAYLDDTASMQQLILEQTASFYSLCEEASRNEMLCAALSEEEKQKIMQLMRYRELLAAEEEKRQKQIREMELRQFLTGNRTAAPSRRITVHDENGRERSLIEIILLIAIQTVEDFQNSNAQQINYYCGGSIQTDWKAQNIMDSICIARELGVNSFAELELKVEEEGRKFGKIKREYHQSKRKYSEEAAELIEAAKLNEFISEEEGAAELSRIQLQLEEKLEQLEASFTAAKQHYVQCAKAMDCIQSQQYRQMGNPLQGLQQDGFVEEEGSGKIQRSAAEAKKIAEQQMREIRTWVDASIDAIAQTPSAGSEKDLEDWKREMEKYGCQIRITKNTISVKHPESNHPIRLNRLGGDYEKERIIYGISIQKQQYAEKRRIGPEDACIAGIAEEYFRSVEPGRDAESFGREQAVENHEQKHESAERRVGTGERHSAGAGESGRGNPHQYRGSRAPYERI